MRKKLLFLPWLLLFPAGHAQGSASFTPLGDLSGGTFSSRAYGISGDGQIVVGESDVGYGAAFWWEAGVIHSAGQGQARAASYDGSTIVGSGAGKAISWARKQQVLGGGYYYQPSQAFTGSGTSVSADGSVIAGAAPGANQSPRAYRWVRTGPTSGNGGFLPDTLFSTQPQQATGVSADGAVLVGYTGTSAFIWTQTSGSVDLVFPALAWETRANGISGDGSAALCTWRNSAGFDDFNDQASVGVVVRGDVLTRVTPYLPFVHSPEHPYGVPAGPADPLAASYDGSVIVGQFMDDAFVWDAVNGYRTLDQVAAAIGLLPQGWHLAAATGISWDGLSIVGYGTNTQGQTEAWLLRIPEPSSAVLLAAGLLSTRPSRRRRA